MIPRHTGFSADFWVGARATDGYRILALCGRGGTVDATDLKKIWVRLRETRDAELLKFGETCQMAIPSQARKGRCRD